MSVLVKGMEMPELYETYKVNFAMTNDGKIVMGMCPLNETGYRPVGEVVALPDHHGRLVDAGKCAEYFWEHLDDNGMAGAMNAINDMPTIVEAEGET